MNTTIPNPSEPPLQRSCKLLDGFAVIIQILLATIALSSLLMKRQREHPRRPLLVWAMDTSKQALAASIIHFTNIFVALISGKDGGLGGGVVNPCVWYFLNILLDTTVGVGILYTFLRLLNYIAQSLKIEDIRSGYYGNPPQLLPWIKQLTIFLLAWFFVKISVIGLLRVLPILSRIAEWLLSPLMGSDTRGQVIVVMLIFPLIMNICQAWLIDMVIKAKFESHGYTTFSDAHLEEAALAGEFTIPVSDDQARLLDPPDPMIEPVELQPQRSPPRPPASARTSGDSSISIISGKEVKGTASIRKSPSKNDLGD